MGYFMSCRLVRANFCWGRLFQRKFKLYHSVPVNKYLAAQRTPPLFSLGLRRNCSNIVDPMGHLEDAAFFELDDEGDLDASIRTTIEYDVSDPVISSLLSCATVQDIFNILNEQADQLTKEHKVQAVLLLWYLQNVFVKVQTQLGSITDVTEADYVAKILEHPEFKELLNSVAKSADQFNMNELSCTLLYLNKMNVNMRSETMQALIRKIEEKLKIDPSCATLTALSRSTVALKYNAELWCQFFLIGLVPLIESEIDEVSTATDFRLLTICLMHTHHLLSTSALDKYKALCKRLVEESVLTPEDGKTIVKALTFLSLKFWANQNAGIVRLLGSLLKGNVKKLEIKELISLNKAFQTHLEPAGLVEEVVLTARSYLRSGNLIPDKDINTGVLSTAAQFASHSERRELEQLLHKELNCDYFLSTMINLFQILRSLKTSDHKLCHLFWSKTTEVLRKHAVQRESLKLMRVAHRYMYFNNNMGGTYRHYGFENQMIIWILDEIQFGMSRYTPAKLNRGVSFLLAYCKESQALIAAVDLLLELGPQLSKIDCVMLSRGVEIMLELNRRRQIHPELMQKLVELDTCMNECAWRHLQEDNLTISGINSLLRTFYNRRASPDSLLFHTIIQRLERLSETENLTSRLIRDLSFCTSGLSCLIPGMIDKMAAYIVSNEDAVMAETAERVLSTAFSLGYTPAAGEDFFSACSRLLQRDKDRLTSLSIIQMCQALCFFHRFPLELLNFVFAVDFLERIDEELATCYCKATYPVRVRYALMELNRSVCLDLPELDVPWFHAKYCEEIATLDPKITAAFHEDVSRQLVAVLGDEKVLQTGVYSPYGYKINFLILLDERTKPLVRREEDKAKQKVAILLHSERQYTAGVRQLKGQQQLRQRHLEMLGYRVIPIAEFVWNAMYLTESHAKRTWLADQLWPER